MIKSINNTGNPVGGKNPVLEWLTPGNLSVIVIFAFALIFWWMRVEHTAAKEMIPSGSNMDMYAYHQPAHEYGFSHLKAGKLPLWNPYTNCGMPFFATYQPGALSYPLNFLHWFLRSELAFSLTYLMHFILSGLFMYLWARRLGCVHVAAAFAGTAYMLCSFVCYPLTWPHHVLCYTWIPIIFFLINRTFYESRWTDAVLLGAAAGCQFLAGYVDGHVYTLYGAFSYILFLALVERFTRGREGRFPARSVMLTVAGLSVIPALLTAFQWIPTFQLSALSARPPEGLSKEAILFGGPLHPYAFLKAFTNPDSFKWGLYSLYSGMLTIVFAVFAFLRIERWRELLYFSVLAMVSTLIAFGSYTFFFDLYLYLPAGDWFRLPHRLLILTAFSIASLAGIGCNNLLKNTLAKPFSDSWISYGIFLGVCGTFIFFLPRKGALYVLILMVGCLLGARSRSAVIVGFLAVVLVGIDLTLHISDPVTYPWITAKVFPDLSKEKEFLRENIGLDRVHIFRKKNSWKNFMLNPNFGMIERIRETSGYESLSLRRYAEFIAYLETAGEPSYKIPFVGWRRFSSDNANPKMLNLLGARYIIEDVGRDLHAEDIPPKEMPKGFSLKKVFSDQLNIYENRDALPRAFFTTSVEVIGEKRKVLERLADPSFGYKKTIILEEEPEPLPESGKATASKKSPKIVVKPLDEGKLEIVADLPESGFIFLNDIFMPGWRATVDETDARIYRADYLFMAIPVTGGEHVLEIQYSPSGHRVGGWISFLSAILLSLSLAFDVARNRAKKMAPWEK